MKTNMHRILKVYAVLIFEIFLATTTWAEHTDRHGSRSGASPMPNPPASSTAGTFDVKGLTFIGDADGCLPEAAKKRCAAHGMQLADFATVNSLKENTDFLEGMDGVGLAGSLFWTQRGKLNQAVGLRRKPISANIVSNSLIGYLCSSGMISPIPPLPIGPPTIAVAQFSCGACDSKWHPNLNYKLKKGFYDVFDANFKKVEVVETEWVGGSFAAMDACETKKKGDPRCQLKKEVEKNNAKKAKDIEFQLRARKIWTDHILFLGNLRQQSPDKFSESEYYRVLARDQEEIRLIDQEIARLNAQP